MDHNYRGRVRCLRRRRWTTTTITAADLPAFTYPGSATWAAINRPILFGAMPTPAAVARGWQRGNGLEGFGADFKDELTKPGGWTFSLTAMGEMLPRYENHVRLNHDKKDQWGMPTLDIDCAWGENEDNMTQDAMEQAKPMMEAAGIQVTAASTTIRHRAWRSTKWVRPAWAATRKHRC